MILSDYDIEQLRLRYDESLRQNAAVIKGAPNMIGHVTEYFFAHDVGLGMKGICSVKALVLDIALPENRDDSPFTVSLAIPIYVKGYYTEEKDISVRYIKLEDEDGVRTSALCRVQDLEVVRAILAAKYQPAKKASGLQLVVNNTSKQD